MNPNWSRWIFISLAKHFDALKGDVANYIVEGLPRIASEEVERVEIRTTGVDYMEFTRGEYQASTTVGLLVFVPLTTQGYRMQALVGRFAEAFKQPIIVKKYGDGPDDDQSPLGCMKVVRNVKTINWGQISENVKVAQSSVECDLTLDLKE